MDEIKVKHFYVNMSKDNFWEAVNILLTKFNVINKRLWSSKIIFRHPCKSLHTNWQAPLTSLTKLQDGDIENFVLSQIHILDLLKESTSNNCFIEVVIVELFPKKFSDKKAFQLVCLDKHNTIATFYDITPLENAQNLCPNFTYSFTLELETLTLQVPSDFSTKSYGWLVDTILPGVMKWGRDDNKTHQIITCTESLSLISKDKYYQKYNELKIKYGKEMVKIWPETTDPSKFVYEDVAIATYLLLLWENDDPQKRNIKFVDLGCGNGLLVYILTMEGHNGVGIDVRKRKIWDMYPKEVKLEETTIIPSDSCLFPEAQWLIGNHSDELTPWLPVIAARSSYECKYFLLPCCAYNFDGTKYQRKDSSKSQYTEYLEYIKKLSIECGFETSIDRLKIPSTKRICLVGGKRTYPETEQKENYIRIQSIIDEGSTHEQDQTQWVSELKTRDPVERVRNCTQIDKKIIKSIVDVISKYLLKDCVLHGEWNIGNTVDIQNLVALLSVNDLNSMKEECGGLQTLLKNNYHIFNVNNGKVQLRYPRTVDEVYKTHKKSDVKVKVKLCWFYKNHPQGCPLTDNACSYMHK